jgi:hypothetical protein
MSDEQKQAGDNPGIDLTNYVPKGEFEKLQADASEARKGLESLKSQLLDADYLSYLESKRQNSQPQAKPTSDLSNINLKNLDMQGLINLINQHSLNAIQQVVGPQIQALHGRLTDVQAVLELDNVRSRYEDFDDYQQDIVGILERAQNDLSIEQAYLQAKGINPNKAQVESAQTVQPARSERPGTFVPLDGETIKTFKNSDEAARAAASEVLARHGLSGDTI